MPGDVAAAAADRIVTLLLQQLLGHCREQHEKAGDADIVEGVVACLVGPLARRLLTCDVADRLHTEVVGLRHPRDVVIFSGPATARRIYVDLSNAVPHEFQAKSVGEPGGAAVATGGVRRPPSDTQAARQLIPVIVEDAGKFQKRCVADGVIADADVPGVVMAVDQHKAGRLCFFGAGLYVRHDNRAGDPSLVQLSTQRDGAAVLLHLLDQPFAVGLIDGGYRRPRLARRRIQVGRTPDRRADSPVNVFARVDVDLANGSLLFVMADGAREAEAVRENDLAAYVNFSTVGKVEKAADLFWTTGGQIDNFGGDTILAGGGRKRRRLGAQPAPCCFHRSGDGHAEEELRLVDVVGHAERLQLLRNVARCLPFILASRFTYERGKALDKGPGSVGRKLVE